MKFELDADEKKMYDAWEKAHLEAEHDGHWPYAGAIGGSTSFTITSTGLGPILGVECNHCRVVLVADAMHAAARELALRDRYHGCLTDFSDW